MHEHCANLFQHFEFLAGDDHFLVPDAELLGNGFISLVILFQAEVVVTRDDYLMFVGKA